MSTSSSVSLPKWIAYNANPLNDPDPSLQMGAAMMGLTLALNQFAQVQGSEIAKLNQQIQNLTDAINLLRTYTPQGNQQSDSTKPNVVSAGGAPWNGGSANQELYKIMQALCDNGLNPGGLFTNGVGVKSADLLSPDQVTWQKVVDSYGSTFTQSQMGSWTQSLQAVSTQLTTQVQTLTAQAAQTTQMSNSLSQAVSSIFANRLQMQLAGAKG